MIIFIAICVIFLLSLLYAGWNVYKYIKQEKTKMSFKESLDLVELPIVTFMCGDKKLNFILDTGSNISYIDKRCLKSVLYKETNEVTLVQGVGSSTASIVQLTLTYKDKTFKDNFGAIDLSGTFDSMKKETGVTVHGLLGSKFFEKYKYIVDFKKLIAYR